MQIGKEGRKDLDRKRAVNGRKKRSEGWVEKQRRKNETKECRKERGALTKRN